jgi:hypothetical protein
VTLSAGTVSLNDGTLQAGSITLASGTTLEGNGGAVSGPIDNSGLIKAFSAHTLDITGNVTGMGSIESTTIPPSKSMVPSPALRR